MIPSEAIFAAVPKIPETNPTRQYKGITHSTKTPNVPERRKWIVHSVNPKKNPTRGPPATPPTTVVRVNNSMPALFAPVVPEIKLTIIVEVIKRK